MNRRQRSTPRCRFRSSCCCAGCSRSSGWRLFSSRTTLASPSRSPTALRSCTLGASLRAGGYTTSCATPATPTPAGSSPRRCARGNAAGAWQRFPARHPTSRRCRWAAPSRRAARRSSLPAAPRSRRCSDQPPTAKSSVDWPENPSPALPDREGRCTKLSEGDRPSVPRNGNGGFGAGRAVPAAKIELPLWVSKATPKRVQKLQMALHAKAKAEAGYRFYALYDKISREDILAHAYAQCRSNKGAPGVDGQDFADIEAYGVERWLAELALALREETYRPEPIRRVFEARAEILHAHLPVGINEGGELRMLDRTVLLLREEYPIPACDVTDRLERACQEDAQACYRAIPPRLGLPAPPRVSNRSRMSSGEDLTCGRRVHLPTSPSPRRTADRVPARARKELIASP